jgi:hypothetical protein
LRITLLYFLGEPVEDNILGVDFLVVDLASQDGPQSLVLRLGPPFLLFLAGRVTIRRLRNARWRAAEVATKWLYAPTGASPYLGATRSDTDPPSLGPP